MQTSALTVANGEEYLGTSVRVETVYTLACANKMAEYGLSGTAVRLFHSTQIRNANDANATVGLDPASSRIDWR